MKRNSAPPSAPSAVADRPPRPVSPKPAPVTLSTPIHFSRGAKAATVASVVGAALVFLYLSRSVVTPFVAAAVVAYAFNPLINWLTARLGVHRVWCVALPYVLGWSATIWALSSYIPILNRETQEVATTLSTLIPELYQHYTNSIQQITLFGVTINIQQQVAETAAAFAGSVRTLGRQSAGLAGGLVETITQVFTFNVALFYLLLDGRRLAPFLQERVPAPYRAEMVALAKQVDVVLGRYLRAQVVLIAIMSCASFVALSVLGVRFSVILALTAGFLEIFPIIGPTAAITLVSLVAFVQNSNHFGWQQVTFTLVVALVFFIMRQLEDYLVVPNIVGHVVQLHPVVILFALFCGGSVAGILGMFLAVPLTGALKILISYLYAKLVEAA